MKTHPIDGFAINFGKKNMAITLTDGIYTIGCFQGTYEEAKQAITDKYGNEYIAKLDDCINMKWLTDEVHEQLKDDEHWYIRIVVAEYSDRSHEQKQTRS